MLDNLRKEKVKEKKKKTSWYKGEEGRGGGMEKGKIGKRIGGGGGSILPQLKAIYSLKFGVLSPLGEIESLKVPTRQEFEPLVLEPEAKVPSRPMLGVRPAAG